MISRGLRGLRKDNQLVQSLSLLRLERATVWLLEFLSVLFGGPVRQGDTTIVEIVSFISGKAHSDCSFWFAFRRQLVQPSRRYALWHSSKLILAGSV